MKKFLSALLSSIFIFSFSISSIAATVTGSAGSASFDIKGSYVPASQSDTYSVDISWGSMNFEYHAADEVWNPSAHGFVANGTPYWTYDEGANAIQVTNHSSKPITATFSYTPAANYSHITAFFDKSTLNLDAPTENSSYSSAPSDTAKITLSGSLSSSTSGSVTFGSVTITISPQSSENDSVSNTTGSVDTDTPVGYLNLYSVADDDTTDIKYNIYAQSSTVYISEFTATSAAVMDSSVGPDTLIYINNTNYYIYEEANVNNKYFYFSAGTTVKLHTEKYDDFEGKTYSKTTSVEAGKKYRMTIDLTNPDEMTATLVEITT